MNKKSIKETIALLTTVIFVGIFAVSFSACGDSKGNGTLTINLNGGRSAMPWPPDEANILDDLVYGITLSNNEEEVNLTAKGTDVIKATVSAGRWNIAITAYYKNEKYAEGTNSVDVIAGQNNSVNVLMYNAFGDPVIEIIFNETAAYLQGVWAPSSDFAAIGIFASVTNVVTPLEFNVLSASSVVGQFRTDFKEGIVFTSAALAEAGITSARFYSSTIAVKNEVIAAINNLHAGRLYDLIDNALYGSVTWADLSSAFRLDIAEKVTPFGIKLYDYQTTDELANLIGLYYEYPSVYAGWLPNIALLEVDKSKYDKDFGWKAYTFPDVGDYDNGIYNK